MMDRIVPQHKDVPQCGVDSPTQAHAGCIACKILGWEARAA